MIQRKRVMVVVSIFLILLIVFFPNLSLTGKSILRSTQFGRENILLGYCPTVRQDAEAIALGKNYDLIEFSSALQVLGALNTKQIDKAVIGRKAKSNEISSEISEHVLKSGVTLISNTRLDIDYSEVNNLEIHTCLGEEEMEDKGINARIIYYGSEQEVISKLEEGKIILISWDDWKDEFELVVVWDGVLKSRDFRGLFLYTN